MKPHIPLILLSALLATAPVKANLAEMETIPGHPAFIPDYDYFIVENDPSSIIPPINKVGCFFAEQPRIYQQYDFRAMAFYKRDANMLALYGGSIESLAGSIILKDVLLIGTSLTTKADGIEDAVWGLPQVAIDGVVFGTSVISVKSNYCTIRNWSGEATNFLLGNTGASFEGGKATGNIQIHSNKDVKVRNLSITNGSLNILDTAATTYGDWVVELNNIHADNGITVQAKSGRGLINVGPIVDSKIGIMHSFTAKEVNFSALANCNIKVQASESVSFADFVKANTLEVLPNNQTRADITFADSLIATSSIKLQGKAIQGTNADAVISASSYQIDASDEVRIQGTFQGGDLTLTAGGAVTLGSLGSLEKPLDSATITGNSDQTRADITFADSLIATSSIKLQGKAIQGTNADAVISASSYQIDASDEVNIKGSWEGGVLKLTAGGAVTLGSLGSLEKPLDSATITGNSALPVNMQSFRGRTLDITTGGAVYVDTIVSSDEQKKRTTINAGGSVNLGSFQGNELRFDAGGDVKLGSFQGEALWFGAKGNAIYVGSIGSLEHPVYDAIIGDSNTTASVTVDSFHCREEDGVLTIESKGVITIGKEREQGAGGAGLPVNEGQVTLLYNGEGSGDEVWDVQVNGEVRGGLYVTAHSGRVNAGHITGIGEIAAKDIHVSSFEGSDLKLNARKNATVLGNIDATGSLIIKPDEIYESGYADIYIQTDKTVQAKTISMQGKDIVSDSAKVVFTAERYDIGATREITFAGTLQGGKIDMTAAGNISLNAVGSSGDPVGTTHITSTEGDIILNSYQGGGLLMSAGGTLNIVKELAISTGFVEVETASEPQRFSACLRGASVSIECDLADNENGYGLYVEATGTQETDTGITISENLDAGKSGKADQLKSAKDINLNGLTSGFLQAEAAGTVTFGGDVQVAGLNGQKALFRAGDEVVFNRTAELTDVDMRAPKVTLGSETTATRLTLSGDAGETPAQVTFEDELTLKDNSRIEGDVASSQSDAAITVENSTITGTVSQIGTVNLANATIGSVENFSTLEAQGASQITSDLMLNDGAELSFVLDFEKHTTPVLTIGEELKVVNSDNPEFSINLTGNKLAVLQKYALITTTNKAQAPDFWKSANVSVSGLSSDPETLFWEGNTLYFSLGGQELKVATWTGDTSSLWNKQDVNWEQKGDSYMYVDGVAVVFNDTGKAGDVKLVGDLKPKSVLVENSEGHDYTFTGEGKITGKTVLVKQGSGTLTVNTANDYSGGTTISGGTLVMGNDKALGSVVMDVKLGDATLDLNECTLDNNVSVTGENACLGNGKLEGILSVEAGRKLTLMKNTTTAGNITLGNGSALDLGGNTIVTTITLKGDATLGNGKLNTALTVADGKTLTLCDDLSGDATITLGHKATLDLARNTLSPQVKLNGDATIGNGRLMMDMTVGETHTLTLGGYLQGPGNISLEEGSTLDLSGHTLSKDVVLTGNAYINTGILDGNVTVGQEGKLTLNGSLIFGNGTVSLADKATLNLNEKIFALAVTVSGNATIGNGTLHGNTLTVEEGSKLTLGARNVETSGNHALKMGDKAAVNLGGNILSGSVSLDGDASIGNGTLNADVAVGAGKTLTLCDGNLGGEGTISLAHLAKLDLGTHTLSKAVVLAGSAFIGNGALDADLTVGDGFTLTLSDNLEGKGTIILKEKSRLNTDSGGTNPNILYNALEVAGDATICGTFEGKISVDAGKELIFESGTSARSGIDLGQNSALDLGTNPIYSTITLVGDASLGNGTVNADVAVGAGYKLSVTSDLEGNGAIILNENSSLDTHGDEVYPYILNNAVKVAGDASIHGTFYGKIAVDAGRRLEFKNGTTAAGGIDLAQGSELDLGGNQTSTAINLAGDATIGSGTINNGSLAVAEEKTLTLRGNVGGTRTISLNTDSTLRLTNGTSVANKITGGLSATIVQTGNESATLTGDLSGFIGNVKVESRGALNIMNAGSMDEVDVTLGRRAILGVYKDANADEASEGTLTISDEHRLAAAFHAQLNANLVMESGSVLDVAATGGESGGLHMGSTVTLDPGNVLLSEADMDAVNGLRYMQAYDLFSGVDGLSLDNGAHFLVELGLSDPWVKASEVFANDLFKSAEREYYLFYSGKNQGGAVGYEGTVYLMRLPEPATGTLSLLALAALAARRRRK